MTLGNRATRRVLAPSVEPQEETAIADEWEDAEKVPEEQPGDLIEVQETFEPAQFQHVPDEYLEIDVMGRGPQEPIRPELEEPLANMPAGPAAGFVNQGRMGMARLGDMEAHDHADNPHAFTARGRTGTVVWGGGGGAGARGNEAAGSIQSQVVPNYQSRMNGPTAQAWVQAGTGIVNVTRSWVGINAGDQANGYYVTTAAAARINAHEPLHVSSAQRLYNAHIQPMLHRLRAYTPAPAGGDQKAMAPAQPAAIASLTATIAWATAMSDFQTADTAANKPMGAVDTSDLATGTYPVDAGPGAVGGTNYTHRIKTPGEPIPT